jgi:hypothetical protein
LIIRLSSTAPYAAPAIPHITHRAFEGFRSIGQNKKKSDAQATAAEDAALFANGFLEAGADTLRLESGRLYLTLTDHSSAELPVDAVQIWRLPDDGAECQVADDRDFERVPLSIERLSAMGFDGGFTQIKYGVTDTMGAQVNVVLGLNETGNLSVTVEAAPSDLVEGASFAFGIIPRA